MSNFIIFYLETRKKRKVHFMQLIVYHCKECNHLVSESRFLEGEAFFLQPILVFNSACLESKTKETILFDGLTQLGYKLRCKCKTALGFYLCAASPRFKNLLNCYSIRTSLLRPYKVELPIDFAQPGVPLEVMELINAGIEKSKEPVELIKYKEIAKNSKTSLPQQPPLIHQNNCISPPIPHVQHRIPQQPRYPQYPQYSQHQFHMGPEMSQPAAGLQEYWNHEQRILQQRMMQQYQQPYQQHTQRNIRTQQNNYHPQRPRPPPSVGIHQQLPLNTHQQHMLHLQQQQRQDRNERIVMPQFQPNYRNYPNI